MRNIGFNRLLGTIVVALLATSSSSISFGGDGWGDGTFDMSQGNVDTGGGLYGTQTGVDLDGTQTQDGELHENFWDGFGHTGHRLVPEEIELLRDDPDFGMLK